MRHFWILPPVLCLAGCVATPSNTKPTVRSQPPDPVVIAAVETTKLIETRYDVRSYQDAANPTVRHEAHAVFRRTRVPLNAPDKSEPGAREIFAPASVAPLPPSMELNAELATQRQITAELRAMQSALADAGEKMKAQYTALVKNSADTIKLRDQLEAERERLRSSAPATDAPTALISPAPTSNAHEVKW